MNALHLQPRHADLTHQTTRGCVMPARVALLSMVLALLALLDVATPVMTQPAVAALQPDPERPTPEGVDQPRRVERVVQAVLGVSGAIPAPGSPGTVVAWGEHAMPVVPDADQGSAVVAAATMGEGAILLLSHTGYGSDEALRQHQFAAFFDAALRAVARPGSPDPVSAGTESARLRVACIGLAPPTALQAPADAIAPVFERTTFEALLADPKAWDVVLLWESRVREAQIEPLRRAIAEGLGVISAQTGWGWRQLNGNAAIDRNGINRLLAPAGLGFGDGFAEVRQGRFEIRAASPMLHAGLALDRLTSSSAPSRDEVRSAESALTAAARVMSADDAVLRPRLLALLDEREGALTPGPSRPLRRAQALERALLAVQRVELDRAKPEDGSAHPAAAAFPGRVDDAAPRISRSVTVNLARPDWHSTGLYAAPGEVIRVSVEGGSPEGVHVQIGCHTDELWHHDAWRRVPSIVRATSLKPGETRLVNPFGGLVYVDVQRPREGTLVVRIEGAVEAPRFVLGETTLEEWQKRLRAAPGPWAELESGKIIVTAPSSTIRALDDPAAVMVFWDKVADAAADLATIPRERLRPERFVADVQISAGYMHAGYPIMTHLDAAEAFVSRQKLEEGQWGLYHELGHNHQSSDWTFDGTGEVTVNLFTMYILETVCGKPVGVGHEALAQRDEIMRRYFAQAPTLERWHSDPFQALIKYQQLREAFGWEAFKQVFAEYRALPANERPRNDDARRDQWLVRMSRTTGRNLGPFFEAWGVRTSAEARASVADLPTWMPDNFPPKP